MLKILRNFIFLTHSMEIFESFLFFLVLSFKLTDNRANTTDVIRQSYAAKSLNKDQKCGFSCVGGGNITKSN